MATTLPAFTFANGFKQRIPGTPWVHEYTPGSEPPNYVVPPSVELLTSTRHNALGENVQRVWPTLTDGTNSPHGTPEWFKKEKEVDVLICGGGFPQPTKPHNLNIRAYPPQLVLVVLKSL